jgi:hypothetical protein
MDVDKKSNIEFPTRSADSTPRKIAPVKKSGPKTSVPAPAFSKPSIPDISKMNLDDRKSKAPAARSLPKTQTGSGARKAIVIDDDSDEEMADAGGAKRASTGMMAPPQIFSRPKEFKEEDFDSD